MERKNKKSSNRLPHRVECRIPESKFQELNGIIEKSQGLTMSELVRNILLGKKVRLIHYDASLDIIMEKLSEYSSIIKGLAIDVNQICISFKDIQLKKSESKALEKVNTSLEKILELQVQVERQWSNVYEKWLQK